MKTSVVSNFNSVSSNQVFFRILIDCWQTLFSHLQWKILLHFISIMCLLRHSFETGIILYSWKVFIASSSVVASNVLKDDMVAIVSNTFRMIGNYINSFPFYKGTVKLVSHIHINICFLLNFLKHVANKYEKKLKFSFLHYYIRNK